MAKDKILSDIKEAEGNARRMVEEGIKQKNDRIASARSEAREILKQAEIDAQTSAKSAQKSAEESIAFEKEKLLQNGRAESDLITRTAESKSEKAVQNLLIEFERAIHA